MTDWYAEVGRPGNGVRASIWIAAVAVSLLVNWSGAVQLESLLSEGRAYAPAKKENVRELDVRVLPLEDRFVEANPEVPTTADSSAVGRRFHDRLDLLHVVDVESRNSVVVLGGVIEHDSHWLISQSNAELSRASSRASA